MHSGPRVLPAAGESKGAQDRARLHSIWQERYSEKVFRCFIPSDDFSDKHRHTAGQPAVSEIISNLYIGAGSDDTLDLRNSHEWLRAHSVSRVVNAAPAEVMYKWHSGEEDEPHGVKIFRLPLLDNASEADAKLFSYYAKEISEFIETGLGSGERVLVHCGRGTSRSAAIVATYLMFQKGMTIADALGLIRSKRRIYPNRGLYEVMIQLEKRERGESSIPIEALEMHSR